MAQDTQNQAAATDVGERYAQALFDLARDDNHIARVENDLRSLKLALAESSDLRTLVGSPAFNAEAKDAEVPWLPGPDRPRQYPRLDHHQLRAPRRRASRRRVGQGDERHAADRGPVQGHRRRAA